jgi:hypothetical protein
MSTLMDMNAESWRPVVGWEDRYLVSDLGRVISLPKHGRGTVLLKPTPATRGGYPQVNLRDGAGGRKVCGVHRLILEAFAGPGPQGALALHADDDPTNNTLANLRWGTRSDNLYDAVRNGRHVMSNKTHCKRGHEFTPENTWVSPTAGGRACRACRKATS